MVKINEKAIIFLILLLIAIGQTSIDIYLPSLPSMADFFNTTPILIQLTLSAFLVGFSISQLFYGPLSDCYGRKPVLLSGLSIYSLSGLLCLLSTSIELFLICRILQGIGIGAASVLSRAIMRDVFEGKTLIKVASYAAIAWALVPIMAPLLGGYIQFYTNWQINFVCLVLFSTILGIIIFKWMPETQAIENRQSLKMRLVLSNYLTLLSSRVFLGNILCISILFGVFIAFSASSPFLLQTQLHLSPITYGWSIMLVSTGYLLSSYLNSRLSQKILVKKIILAGFIIFLVSSLFLFLFAFAHIFNLMTILVPMFFIFFGVGLIYSNCIAGCMKLFPHIAGSAGAIYGFLVFLGGSLASTLISHFPMRTAKPLAIIIGLQMIISLSIYWLLIHNRPNDRAKTVTITY